MNQDWNLRAQASIAQGALTNSKNPRSLVFGVYPTHVYSGSGAVLADAPPWESCRREYVDFMCALGANFLGYDAPPVRDAVLSAIRLGACHSLPTRHEVEAAELLKELLPFVDLVKFLKTGTEACSAAIRIARAHTGRMKVFSDGYHGWSDDFVSLTPPASGVPDHPDMGKLTGLSDITSETAAVIVEPVITDHSPERRRYLEELRARCTETGTLLIFDEVITGFRFKDFSVANCWNIRPDLIVVGKAIANGLPLAAVGGPSAIMNTPGYFVSSTFAGEIWSLAAACAVMRELQKKDRYNLDTLWTMGQRFMDEFNQIAPEVLKIEGYPTRGIFRGTELDRALFFQEACKAGVIFCISWFFNWPLIQHMDFVLQACRDILPRIGRGEIRLEGELPQSPFSMRARGIR